MQISQGARLTHKFPLGFTTIGAGSVSDLTALNDKRKKKSRLRLFRNMMRVIERRRAISERHYDCIFCLIGQMKEHTTDDSNDEMKSVLPTPRRA